MSEETRDFAELLPYMVRLTDDVVVCKDSGLLATFEIEGKDYDSISESEAEAILQQIETALYPLRVSPWKVWFTLKRFKAESYPGGFEDSDNSNQVAALLNNEHRAFFDSHANYATKAYISFYLAADTSSNKYTMMDRLTTFVKRTGMMLSDGQGFFTSLLTGARASFSSRFAFAYKAHELVQMVEGFERTISASVSVLSAVGLKRLQGGEFLGFLRSMSSGYANPDQPVDQSHWDWFLDSVLPDSRMEVGTDKIRLGDNLLSVLSMKEWPANTDARLVPTLMRINSEMTFSCAFCFLSNDQSKQFISGMKAYAEITKFTLKNYISASMGKQQSDDKANQYALEMIQDAKDAEAAVDKGVFTFGLMNLSLIVKERITDKSENGVRVAEEILDIKTGDIIKSLATLYPGIIREELHLLSAWAGTLPGQWSEPVRWSFMHTGNLADSAPVFLLNEGEKVNEYLTKQTGKEQPALSVFPTAYNTPFYFNFHQGDLGHTFLAGPSRAGKSVLMNFLISQWQKYEPCRAIIFDKDNSCRINTLMHDGEYFDLRPGAKLALNPFHLVDDREHWPFLIQWVTNFIEAKNYKVTSEDEEHLYKNLEHLTTLATPEDKRFHNFVIGLPQHLSVHLELFVGGGPLADYFDSPVDKFSLASITAFEMGSIMENPRIARAFIDYAFYRIMQALKKSKEAGELVIPTIIYLEEVWYLFEDERFREKIRDWLKTLAKLNAIVVMATQSLEDISESGKKFFASIRDNVPTRIYLPNAQAGTSALRKVYMEEFGLPEEYVDLIRVAVPKRDYLIVTNSFAKVIQSKFSEVSLAVLRSDTKAQGIFDLYYQKTPDWKQRYIYHILGEEFPDPSSESTVEGVSHAA